MQSHPTRVLIVGYGNPLRSDDGFGHHAALQLENALSASNITVITRQQLTLDLAEEASRFQLIIFIDAARDCSPGEMRCEKIPAGDIHRRTHASGLSHFLTPASLLSWTAELYAQFPEAYYISVGGESFAHGETVSAAVQAAFPAVLARVRSLIAPGEPPNRPA